MDEGMNTVLKWVSLLTFLSLYINLQINDNELLDKLLW